jgi:peptidoglycan/LPS O-acetylase OafA/YrhL
MQRIDRNFILTGLTWVIVGMIYGAWLGASHQNNFANSHAHINLLGFVTSVLFGILYWAYPSLAKSRLAIWQFAIYEIGVLLLVIGKILVDRDNTETPFLQIGSLVTIVGTAMMLYLFARDKTAR